MSPTSVSKSDIMLESGGRFCTLIRLKRHLAPRTVGTLLRSLPIQANAHFFGRMLYISTGIDSGLERHKNDFAGGEVAFHPGDGTLCIFLDDTRVQRKMSFIGRIQGDVDVLSSIKSGDPLALSQETG